MLKADSITKRFGTKGRVVTALERVSLELAPGARLGLTGPSGSGKSTLAIILAMLLRPDAGNVEVDGEPVRAWGIRAPRQLRRQVQLVWQSPRLASDPRMRLRQLILEPLIAAEGARAAAEGDELLGHWALAAGLTHEILDRFPHEVSEGQLQRACLARALIIEPRYLICDEATSMLDVSTQAAVLAAISAAQERAGFGVLMITHDRGLARHWCDEVHDIRTRRLQPSFEKGA